MYTRFRAALANDRECVFDCGPHAKCVCGVCVKDSSPCPVPCDICAGASRALFTLVTGPSALLMCFVFVSLLCRGRQRAPKPRFTPVERMSLWKKVLLACCLLGWALLVWRLTRQPALDRLYGVVTGVIPEELFPSDHLFLSASISHRS